MRTKKPVHRILTVVGARPQFIKAAVVSSALKATSCIDEILVHTGQHYDRNMSEVFFRELDLPRIAYNLEVGSASHGVQTAQMLEGLERVMVRESPAGVLIFGDTNSTLAGALAASKLRIPLWHVEAGLRSYNRDMPEEINRLVADALSTVLFSPSSTATSNLLQEGVPRSRIVEVGDVMYDAVLRFRSLKFRTAPAEKPYVLATIHRAENTEVPHKLAAIFTALRELAKTWSVIVPMHPRTRSRAATQGIAFTGLQVREPVGYLEMLQLEQGADVIVTDSGGVQKEAFFHRVPCVTVRHETEWVETVQAGWNVLASPSSSSAIVAAVQEARDRHKHTVALYGDGRAAVRIAEYLASALSGSSKE